MKEFRIHKAYWGLFLLQFWGVLIIAQTNPLSNQRTAFVPCAAATYVLDTLSIVASTVQLQYAAADSSLLKEGVADSLFVIGNTTIQLKQCVSDAPLIAVQYRVLPFDLEAMYTHLDKTIAVTDSIDGLWQLNYKPYEEASQLLDFGGLNYNGSFSRGLSFGNNQGVVLNSNFNLQLAGNLGDDVEILAAITDENIPLQPEGNTQQLQEFDKIFIQLKRRNNQLIAGDYELQRPKSYFLSYYKKLQGATASNTTKLANGKLHTKGSVAIARGKFARNTVQAIEGNQGPYKLRGSESERFIIALAGTEKVFIDGALLQRGLEADYVIDYNRAEVRFTNKRLITKDSRIIIEFEYADQNYLTALYAVNSDFESEKWTVSFNLFHQQDGKSSVGDEGLSSLQQEILAAAGDDPSRAVINSVDTLEIFDPLRVLYEYRDTTIQIGGIDRNFQVLVYTPTTEARLTARFSEVGEGNGNYQLSTARVNANGRVYEWVAPDSFTGQARGNYEPVIQLAAPKRQQLATLNSTYRFNKNGRIRTELALSNNDQNRFSIQDSDDDSGLAGYTELNQGFQLGKSEKNWRLETKLSYEWVQQHFKALNPYRAAEFTRDWNSNTMNPRKEQIGRAGFVLNKQGLGSWEYVFSGFVQDSIYTGTKHFSQLKINRNNWVIDGQASLLQSDGIVEQSTFFRPRLQVRKSFEKLKNWSIGIYGEREKNDRFNKGIDTLNNTSFYYDLYRLSLQSAPNKNWQTALEYRQRFDYAPSGQDFEQTSIADELNINGNWKAGRSSKLNWNMTYRNLRITNEQLTPNTPKETYLGRINHSLLLAKGAIRSNTSYEISSGQEPKIEYNYLQVNPGEGTHEWLDYNQDSIPQVNEFEIAAFADKADYIRVSLFTDDFIRSNNVQYNQSLNLDPKAVWFKAKGVKKFLSRFSTQSTVRILRRVREAENVSPWNPFQLNIADTALVATTASIRNTLHFNRANPVFNAQVGQQDNQQKQVAVSGFERRRTTEYFWRSRWNITRQLSLQTYLAQGIRSSDSELFDNRDYELPFLKIEPQLTFLPAPSLRAILSYKFEDSHNQLGSEQSNKQDFALELTFNQNTKTAIRARLAYIRVGFEGDPNSPIGFALLNGLRDGRNYLWNATLDRKIGRNVRLNLSYEGRKTGTANIIHVGRAQVAAVF